jgi:hypothetical protein
MFAMSPFALAQDKKEAPKKTPTAAQKKQQDRMRDCNAQAGDKKLEGDERKKFMSSCLKGGSDKGGKMSAQQEKMRACNKEASGKKLAGDQRKKFMSECLKA